MEFDPNKQKNLPLCPISRTAVIFSSRWTPLILRELIDHGPRRFQDFMEKVEGIAPATLSTRLKILEQSGLVVREFYEEHPPRARYCLTEKGLKTSGIINAMRDWGKNYNTDPQI